MGDALKIKEAEVFNIITLKDVSSNVPRSDSTLSPLVGITPWLAKDVYEPSKELC